MNEIAIEHGALGIAGTSGELVSVPMFAGQPDNARERMEDNSLRDWECHVVFDKRSNTPIEFNSKVDSEEGGSYLEFEMDVKSLEIHSPFGKVSILKNSKNEISKLVFNCKCNSKNDAFDTLFKAINPILDNLSYEVRIPFYIAKVLIEDLKNKVTCLTYTTPYPNRILQSHMADIPNEILPVLALYREAKNSNSNFYKIFCYSKIFEGIFKSIRPANMKRLKKNNITFERRVELIPEHYELRLFHSEHIGKPIQQFYETYVIQNFRNAVAHFALDNSEPLNLSDYLAHSNYAKNIALLEISCLVVIENEIIYLKL